MKTITITSLAGGQGKTTTAFFLAKLLAQSHNILTIDADPQANLTFYFGHKVEDDDPTLLEMLKKDVPAQKCLYQLKHKNLFLIPADRGLEAAQTFLADSGVGASVLGNRLKALKEYFDYCIIDAPPARSQLPRTALGAADFLVIPAEVTPKGVNSIIDTFELIKQLEEYEVFTGSILGVLPFRDKYFGRNQSKQTTQAKKAIQAAAKKFNFAIFSSLLESEKVKEALHCGKLPSELGYSELQHCFEQICSKL